MCDHERWIGMAEQEPQEVGRCQTCEEGGRCVLVGTQGHPQGPVRVAASHNDGVEVTTQDGRVVWPLPPRPPTSARLQAEVDFDTERADKRWAADQARREEGREWSLRANSDEVEEPVVTVTSKDDTRIVKINTGGMDAREVAEAVMAQWKGVGQTERGYPPVIEQALREIKNANITGVSMTYDASGTYYYTFTVEG
jgi:hypothetical protein